MKVSDVGQIRAADANRQAEVDRVQKGAQSAEDRVTTQDPHALAAVVAAETARSSPATCAALLQSIETAVRSGTYQPDPNRIAQQILDDAELAARLQALLSR